jgi:putative addiction module component (TIGR02574 family)
LPERYAPSMAVPAMPPPGFDNLSPEEKLDYIHALWARFTADPEEVPIPEWHHEVIAERLAAAERGEGSARPWEAVRQDLLAKLRDVRR